MTMLTTEKKVDRKGSSKVSQANETRWERIMYKYYIIKCPRSRLYRLLPC
jgi:hypothetical protein